MLSGVRKFFSRRPIRISVNLRVKRKLEANDMAGIRPSKSIRALEVKTGGPDKLDCLVRDCRNYVESVGRLNIGVGDANCIKQMFLRMQEKNCEFSILFTLMMKEG